MNNNWSQTSLGELENNGEADIQTGPFGTVLKASEYSDRGSPVISVGEIRYGYLHVSGQTPKVSDKTKERLPQFILRAGDIVFGRKGAIDRNSIINESQNGWFLGSDGIRLRLSGDFDNLFVSYQFRCPTIGKWLLQNSSGSVMPSLNQKTLNRLPLWLPNIHEQQGISTVLSTLDKKIALNNKINTELEAMAKLIYDYWFVQFDFPDANGKPYKSSGGKMVYNEALKREIPEGWAVGNIMQLAHLLGGGTPKTTIASYWRGSIPFFTPADAASDVFSLKTKQNVTTEGLKNCSSKLFEKGTIFITARGTVGKINIASCDMAMNQSCYALQGKEGVGSTFIYFYASELIQYVKSKASGSIFKALVTNDFKFTGLVIPPMETIARFTNTVDASFDKLLLNKLENQELTELRDWLLPMLMNGQVTVKDAAP
ncbi:MAG: type I restriction enzyme S subunit [Kiritimatiellia bacterium]|jgi:type I restriction enzyme S subunit